MTDAAKVQQLPVTTEQSKDVLTDLLQQTGFDGKPLVNEKLVAMLTARVELGFKKYGKRLESFNGRDVFLDIRQELLDEVMYGHQGTMQGYRVAHLRNRAIKSLEELDRIEEAHGKS